MGTSELDQVRALLLKLKHRLAAGEITREAYRELVEDVTAGLTSADRSALGLTPIPTPRPGQPGSGVRIGPSGGRTKLPGLADLTLAPGTVLFDQWTITREIGRGGFGAVFEAKELKLSRVYAIKVLDPAMVAREELLDRFRREVSIMRDLVHARIVRVYDYREDLEQHLALISMELVRGCNARDITEAARRLHQPVPVPLALAILGQTLEALSAAHANDIVHRDVTPANILLAGGGAEDLLADPTRDPQVKLVDFGIAGLVEKSELSKKTQVQGTIGYLAPELEHPDADITSAADVYGAGAVAYELLTGERPTGRFPDPSELRPELSKDVDDLLLRLLQRSPARRAGAKEAHARAVALADTHREAWALDRKRRDLGEVLQAALQRGDEVAATEALASLEAVPSSDTAADLLDQARSFLADRERERQWQARREELTCSARTHLDAARYVEAEDALEELRAHLGARVEQDRDYGPLRQELAERFSARRDDVLGVVTSARRSEDRDALASALRGLHDLIGSRHAARDASVQEAQEWLRAFDATTARLRQALDRAVGQEDGESAALGIKELGAHLGPAAEHDAGLLQAKAWLNDLSARRTEERFREALASAFRTGLGRDVEKSLGALEKHLGARADRDPDVAAARRWVEQRAEEKRRRTAATEALEAALQQGNEPAARHALELLVDPTTSERAVVKRAQAWLDGLEQNRREDEAARAAEQERQHREADERRRVEVERERAEAARRQREVEERKRRELEAKRAAGAQARQRAEREAQVQRECEDAKRRKVLDAEALAQAQRLQQLPTPTPPQALRRRIPVLMIVTALAVVFGIWAMVTENDRGWLFTPPPTPTPTAAPTLTPTPWPTATPTRAPRARPTPSRMPAVAPWPTETPTLPPVANGVVEVQTNRTGWRLRVDYLPVGTPPLSINLAPGSHWFQAEFLGRSITSQLVQVRANEHVVLDFDDLLAPPLVLSPARPQEELPTPTSVPYRARIVSARASSSLLLSGMVTDGSTRLPGVTVFAYWKGGSPKTTVTGIHGQFSIPISQRGTIVKFELAGYCALNLMGITHGGEVVVEMSQVRIPEEVTMGCPAELCSPP